ncbi:MAG: hypothetical protein WBO43_15215, partial [Gemmatimonadota bacterium]
GGLDSINTAEFGPTCERMERQQWWVVCHSAFSTEPDWEYVLTEATGAGVWLLPDPSVLSDDELSMTDGWGLTIELRDGPSYRTFQYRNPDAQPWPEARQAEALFRIVEDVWRHAPEVAQTEGENS